MVSPACVQVEFIVEEKTDENDKIREKIRSYADMRAGVQPTLLESVSLTPHV